MTTVAVPLRNPKMSIRLDVEQAAWLRLEGRRRGLSQGAIVRGLLDDAMRVAG